MNVEEVLQNFLEDMKEMPKKSNISRLKAYFKSLSRFPSSSIKSNIDTLMEAILMYITVVINELAKETYREQITSCKKWLDAIQLVVTEDMQTDFVKHVTPRVFNILIEEDKNSWCIKKEVLKMFIQCVQSAPRELRYNTVNELPDFFLFKIVDCISASGDFDYQVTLIEMIYRMYGKNAILPKLKDLIPESQELSQSFASINPDTFDEDVRQFLNILNKASGKVFSVICENILIGDVKCERTVEDVNGFWVDFNMSEYAVSFYCTKSSVTSNDADTSDMWNLVLFFVSDVDYVKVVNSPRTKKTVLYMKLNVPCLSTHEDNFSSAKELNFVFSRRSSVTTTLTAKILPKLFKHKFRHETQKVSHSQKMVYRPLKVSVLKRPRSSSSKTRSDISFSGQLEPISTRSDITSTQNDKKVFSISSASTKCDVISIAESNDSSLEFFHDEVMETYQSPLNTQKTQYNTAEMFPAGHETSRKVSSNQHNVEMSRLRRDSAELSDLSGIDSQVTRNDAVETYPTGHDTSMKVTSNQSRVNTSRPRQDSAEFSENSSVPNLQESQYNTAEMSPLGHGENKKGGSVKTSRPQHDCVELSDDLSFDGDVHERIQIFSGRCSGSSRKYSQSPERTSIAQKRSRNVSAKEAEQEPSSSSLQFETANEFVQNSSNKVSRSEAGFSKNVPSQSTKKKESVIEEDHLFEELELQDVLEDARKSPLSKENGDRNTEKNDKSSIPKKDKCSTTKIIHERGDSDLENEPVLPRRSTRMSRKPQQKPVPNLDSEPAATDKGERKVLEELALEYIQESDTTFQNMEKKNKRSISKYTHTDINEESNKKRGKSIQFPKTVQNAKKMKRKTVTSQDSEVAVTPNIDELLLEDVLDGVDVQKQNKPQESVRNESPKSDKEKLENTNKLGNRIDEHHPIKESEEVIALTGSEDLIPKDVLQVQDETHVDLISGEPKNELADKQNGPDLEQENSNAKSVEFSLSSNNDMVLNKEPSERMLPKQFAVDQTMRSEVEERTPPKQTEKEIENQDNVVIVIPDTQDQLVGDTNEADMMAAKNNKAVTIDGYSSEGSDIEVKKKRRAQRLSATSDEDEAVPPIKDATNVQPTVPDKQTLSDSKGRRNKKKQVPKAVAKKMVEELSKDSDVHTKREKSKTQIHGRKKEKESTKTPGMGKKKNEMKVKKAPKEVIKQVLDDKNRMDGKNQDVPDLEAVSATGNGGLNQTCVVVLPKTVELQAIDRDPSEKSEKPEASSKTMRCEFELTSAANEDAETTERSESFEASQIGQQISDISNLISKNEAHANNIEELVGENETQQQTSERSYLVLKKKSYTRRLRSSTRENNEQQQTSEESDLVSKKKSCTRQLSASTDENNEPLVDADANDGEELVEQTDSLKRADIQRQISNESDTATRKKTCIRQLGASIIGNDSEEAKKESEPFQNCEQMFDKLKKQDDQLLKEAEHKSGNDEKVINEEDPIDRNTEPHECIIPAEINLIDVLQEGDNIEAGAKELLTKNGEDNAIEVPNQEVLPAATTDIAKEPVKEAATRNVQPVDAQSNKTLLSQTLSTSVGGRRRRKLYDLGDPSYLENITMFDEGTSTVEVKGNTIHLNLNRIAPSPSKRPEKIKEPKMITPRVLEQDKTPGEPVTKRSYRKKQSDIPKTKNHERKLEKGRKLKIVNPNVEFNPSSVLQTAFMDMLQTFRSEVKASYSNGTITLDTSKKAKKPADKHPMTPRRKNDTNLSTRYNKNIIADRRVRHKKEPETDSPASLKLKRKPDTIEENVSPSIHSENNLLPVSKQPKINIISDVKLRPKRALLDEGLGAPGKRRKTEHAEKKEEVFVLLEKIPDQDVPVALEQVVANTDVPVENRDDVPVVSEKLTDQEIQSWVQTGSPNYITASDRRIVLKYCYPMFKNLLRNNNNTEECRDVLKILKIMKKYT